MEQAAHCDSSYDSYRSRLRTLSALSLVNRIFRDLAQPLLPQKVWLKEENEMEEFKRIGKTEEVANLRHEHKEKKFCRQNFEGFSFMTEFRIGNTARFNITTLDQHQHLKRLALEDTSVLLKTDFYRFALPRLEELSLDSVGVTDDYTLTTISTSSFLTASRFPSLRALSVKRLFCQTLFENGDYGITTVDYYSIPQLDCVTLDEHEYQSWIRSHQSSSGSSLPSFSSIPLLFDIDSTLPFSSYAPGSSVCANSHVRLQLVSDSIADNHRTVSRLEALLARSTILKEVYLEASGRDARGSDKGLRRRIEEVEQFAEQKNVEFIWENHGDDWCRSRVSKEFWRKSKEKREKAREME
ncbi:hypothetical protein JCM5350_007158 [Sporobolomyces pararoseus]